MAATQPLSPQNQRAHLAYGYMPRRSDGARLWERVCLAVVGSTRGLGTSSILSATVGCNVSTRMVWLLAPLVCGHMALGAGPTMAASARKHKHRVPRRGVYLGLSSERVCAVMHAGIKWQQKMHT